MASTLVFVNPKKPDLYTTIIKNSLGFFCIFYQNFSSIVLLGLCDYRYKLLMVDVGSFGHNSDAGIYNSSLFKIAVEENHLNLPPPAQLPNSNILSDFYFVADAAFPLETFIQKPIGGTNLTLEEKIYNYRISRARRLIENVFGILAMRWRILLKKIETNVDTAVDIVKAACR